LEIIEGQKDRPKSTVSKKGIKKMCWIRYRVRKIIPGTLFAKEPYTYAKQPCASENKLETCTIVNPKPKTPNPN